jgi:putative ABC transport system permease protein
MIFNYLILAWRNLTAHKTVSFINIFGLSIAVACCVTVFLFLRNYWTLDSFHTNSDRIFIVEYKTETDGQTQIWGDAPAPMAHALAQDFPQIERTVRVSREGVIVSSGEHTFDELVTYTDTGFFQMFTFPLTIGSPAALKDPSAIILSAEIAEKYFPGEMPLGRSIRLITSNQEKKIFTVQGVAAPFPDNASLRFDFLVGYSPAMSIKATEDWTKRGDGIFVQLRQPTDAAILTDQMSRYLPLFNSHNLETPATAFVLDNLKNPIPKAYDINQRPTEAAHPLLAAMMSAIALLLLLLSCFNYVNISLGAATRRLKEIGIRKVMGGQRRQLIWQFMAENLLLCTLSLVLGLVLCQTIFAPMMNGLIVNIHLGISFSKNPDLWLFLIGLLGLTALASGAYPALYISAFRPTAIFTGKLKFSNKSTFRRVLLSTQFGLAFVAIILSVVLLAAGKHWSKMAWGYDPSQTWVVQLTDSTQYGLLKNELLKQPNVQSISGASLHVGLGSDREEIKIGEVTTPVRRYNVGAGYANTLGLQLQAGRFFEEHRTVEDEQSVVVNETFVKKQGWDNAIGQQIRVGEKQYRVAGVLKDFKMLGTGAINSAMFFCEKENDFSFLAVRYAAGSGQQVADQTIQDYQRLFNSAPISHFFQQEVFDGFNRTFWSVAKSFGYIAGLALLIACLGLYGLATQQYARRMKEVSVRKLLGASVGQIVLLVNREFMFMLLLAGGISTALCFICFQLIFNQLDQFVGTYRPGILPFLLANLLVFVTAALAIGQHSWRLAKVQLGEVLKNSE